MSRPKTSKALVVNEPSDNIFKAIAFEEKPLPELNESQVLIKMLAAPINPSDVAIISGKYMIFKDYPYGVGFEGVAEIAEVGSNVTSVKVGDRVMLREAVGTWRDYAVLDENKVAKSNPDIPVKAAATMFVNPCTAYYMLVESGLKEGQTLIQNGANSMVGKALIQIAKSMGIKTINVVRNRANLAELVAELKELGADVVITDDDLKEGKLDVKVPLAIDCVAGEAGALLLKQLEKNGTLLSYGCLSGQPIPAHPGDLVMYDLTIKGYHLRTSIQNPQELLKAYSIIGNMILEGKLKPPHFETFKLEDHQKALERATAGFTNKKQIFVMDDSLM